MSKKFFLEFDRENVDKKSQTVLGQKGKGHFWAKIDPKPNAALAKIACLFVYCVLMHEYKCVNIKYLPTIYGIMMI